MLKGSMGKIKNNKKQIILFVVYAVMGVLITLMILPSYAKAWTNDLVQCEEYPKVTSDFRSNVGDIVNHNWIQGSYFAYKIGDHFHIVVERVLGDLIVIDDNGTKKMILPPANDVEHHIIYEINNGFLYHLSTSENVKFGINDPTNNGTLTLEEIDCAYMFAGNTVNVNMSHIPQWNPSMFVIAEEPPQDPEDPEDPEDPPQQEEEFPNNTQKTIVALTTLGASTWIAYKIGWRYDV